jgi:hypothetical protein
MPQWGLESGLEISLPPRARICERLWSPGIDSEDSISPAYVAWRAGTRNRVVVPARQTWSQFLGSITGPKIRALYMLYHQAEMTI